MGKKDQTWDALLPGDRIIYYTINIWGTVIRQEGNTVRWIDDYGKYHENHRKGCHYMPTEQEIANECAKIQKNWTPAERTRRMYGSLEDAGEMGVNKSTLHAYDRYLNPREE